MARILAHAHSNWSHDSKLTLVRWIKIAKCLRCDVILFAEHEESGWTQKRYDDYVSACHKSSTKEIALIPGIEFIQEGFHILCYALSEYPPRPSSIEELYNAAHRQGRWLCLAHPGKYSWRCPLSIMSFIDTIEVWNSKWIYDGFLGPHPESIKLAQDKGIIVGQDVHEIKDLALLLIETPTLDYLSDLKKGNFKIRLMGFCWMPEKLRTYSSLARILQRVRTKILRIALRIYKRI